MEILLFCSIGKREVLVPFILVLLTTWAESQEVSCHPCKKVTGETGTEPYIGMYHLLPGVEPYCRNGCAYQLADSDLRFCFAVQPSPYTTVECNQTSLVLSNSSTWSIQTLIEENGEIIVQTDVFDNNTGEVTIDVPAHGDREPITILMSPETATLVTSKVSKCQIKSLPNDVNPLSMNSSGDVVAERGEDPITGDTEQVIHAITIETEEVTSVDINGLSPAAEEVCKGKKIVLTEEKVVTGEEFDKIKKGGVIDVGPRSKRKKRQTGSGNCTLTRMCGSRSSSCWRWPYGTAFSMHHLNLDLLCVECCSNGVSTDNFCDCQQITSLEQLEQCTLPDNQTCPDGFYFCDGTCQVEVGEPVDSCNGTCPESRVPCGEKCIPEEWNTNLYSHYKQWMECDGHCIRANNPCNGICPDGLTACGDRCVLDSYVERYYQICDGECITSSTPCNGDCGEGYVICGDICRRDGGDWRTCQDDNSSKCIYKTEACDGVCPLGRNICGNSTRCIVENDPSYLECNGICISYSTPCDSICPNGTVLCGDKCIHEQESNYYKECNGICIYNNDPCNGECPERMILCSSDPEYYESDYGDDGYCQWDDGTRHKCGDICLYNQQKCNGSCTEGWSSCRVETNNSTNENDWYQCYNDDKSELRACNNKCIWESEHCNENCPQGYYFCSTDQRCKELWRQCSGTCQDEWEPCPNWGVCYNNDSSVPYKLCGDKCIRTMEACDGECQPGTEICGYGQWDHNNRTLLCYGDGSANFPCNGICMTNGTACEGECPDGYSVCLNGYTLEEVCYSNTSPSDYYKYKGYCWNGKYEH